MKKLSTKNNEIHNFEILVLSLGNPIIFFILMQPLCHLIIHYRKDNVYSYQFWAMMYQVNVCSP